MLTCIPWQCVQWSCLTHKLALFKFVLFTLVILRVNNTARTQYLCFLHSLLRDKTDPLVRLLPFDTFNLSGVPRMHFYIWRNGHFVSLVLCWKPCHVTCVELCSGWPVPVPAPTVTSSISLSWPSLVIYKECHSGHTQLQPRPGHVLSHRLEEMFSGSNGGGQLSPCISCRRPDTERP